MQRPMVAWIAEAPDKVSVMPRPLKYGGGAPREKGVDVELAIDLVQLAIDDAFDVCAVASADTDLVPVLQFVAQRFPHKGLVTVAYMPDEGLDARAALDLPGVPVERHLIPHRDFDRMIDRRNFYDSRALPDGIDSARLERLQRRIHGR